MGRSYTRIDRNTTTCIWIKNYFSDSLSVLIPPWNTCYVSAQIKEIHTRATLTTLLKWSTILPMSVSTFCCNDFCFWAAAAAAAAVGPPAALVPPPAPPLFIAKFKLLLAKPLAQKKSVSTWTLIHFPNKRNPKSNKQSEMYNERQYNVNKIQLFELI